jgi:hypothetical protein
MDVHAGPLTHFPAHYCVGLAHNVDVPRDVNVPVGADKQYEKQEYAHCKIPGESVRAFVEGRREARRKIATERCAKGNAKKVIMAATSSKKTPTMAISAPGIPWEL